MSSHRPGLRFRLRRQRLPAVACASPVTMIVRTPKAANSATRAAEVVSRRIAERDEPGHAQLSWRPGCDSEDLNPLACNSSTMAEAAGGSS